ncbi:MAG TPA: NAD-glutamate dehydrogenase [Solirubrobacteraceae bacterium]|nr:NAD-glutamate dehydrogenase [Solirubrobacteraceae bacterium]
MTAAASLLDLIGERTSPERAPAARAFAQAFLRRLSADGGDAEIEPDVLCREIVGAFEFASARGAEPIAVRAFVPTVEEHGYEAPGSVVETNTEDWPFLVDSVSAELRVRGLGIQRVLHPIVGVERDADGAIEAVLHPREASRRESVMHFDLDRRLSPEELAELEEALRRVLSDVRATVHDFPSMADRARRMVQLAGAGASRYSDEEVDETVAFLEWLLHDNFIFLGYREYRFRDGTIAAVRDSGLGILADTEQSSFAKPVPIDSLPEGVRERALDGDLLIVSKTNRRARVHRNVRMDYVGVRRISHEGEIVGEARMLGLFTTKAYAEPASQTPLLHRKLRQILRSEDLIEGSHDYKAAVSLFDSFPKDELFAASTTDLRGAVVALLGLQGEQVRLLGRRDPDRRSASLIVALPRSRYDGELLTRLQDLFRERFATDAVDSHLVLGEGERVQVHFRVHASEGLPDVDVRELEREVVAATRTWEDELRDALVARHGDIRGRALAVEWGARFPRYYRASTSPQLAVHDIGCFARLETLGEPFVVGLQNERDENGERTRIGLYKTGGKVELAEAMPMLEDLGLRVIEEVPTRLKGGDGDTWVQDFGVLGPGDQPIDLQAHGARVADCISAVWRGDTESDTLNRLVLVAGLDWRQIEILRAYRKYRQRVGSRFTESYQNDVLAASSALTAKLVRLFELRFDPEHERDEAAEAALREEILSGLDAVESLDHDRILRNQLGLIEATLRTNAYRRGRGAMAFKISSPHVPAIPEPAPLVEIYVYSAEMEGIHLRGGRIARGGIRWSDRMDYRTEVYGLMRAQLTKNAQIVPEGAKGGFYLKHRPADPSELREAVQRQYVAYVRGLLDVTDNLVDGEVVHPPDTRVLDGRDTYLVVAADKGTATFSDIANQVAEDYGFWLGDAFASGGSSGYDHKKLGITARGAWESVKRHFLELELDVARDPFTVVGIGDMSGDVFGNGMLLSDRIRLVAAYDHRNIFIDPDPDPDVGFAERKRLFDLAGSSWNDYDRSKISEGGGVWPRTAKWIPLSEAAQRALGIEDEALAPNDVIRDILRAPVDLLWNGGIGTVVKASDETDDAAQDRSSDAIRVDASELRCRVVGEGGNLGFTRRARVEFTRSGGRVNADFIDNSAGVDCSDHEVNLKVLLGLAERAGELTRPDRDALLRDVTGDVVEHVLYDSFLQAQIIAQETRRSASRLDAYEDLMVALEEEGLLDRAAEALPSGEELAERRRAGRGMERPELSLLLTYAKRRVKLSLLESELLEDPWLGRDLRDYFPHPVVERFGAHLPAHPLRRELIATINANHVVNALGPVFVSQLVSERGARPAEVVRAYRIAREVTGAEADWEAIESLEGQVEPEVQAELMGGVDALVDAVTRWYLSEGFSGDLATTIEVGRKGFQRLAAAAPELGGEELHGARRVVAERLVNGGAPEGLAAAHALRPGLVHAPAVTVVAAATERPVEDVARVFVGVGERLPLNELEEALDTIPATRRMERWALQAVREDARRARRDIAERALSNSRGADPGAALDAFLAAHAEECRRLGAFKRTLAREGTADMAGLALAVRQLRTLVD